MDILEKIDLIIIDEVFKKVIRKGKVQRKLICPLDTMKAQDGKCVLMPPSERKKRNKAAIKRGKMLHANIGVQKKAQKKRAKSLKKRSMQIADMGGSNESKKIVLRLDKNGKEIRLGDRIKVGKDKGTIITNDIIQAYVFRKDGDEEKAKRLDFNIGYWDRRLSSIDQKFIEKI